MSGYVKKIAVIKQLKSGFSTDGGVVGGIVKAEAYAGYLKVETSLINFAPLAEGRYVYGISDGLHSIVFEDSAFEGESDIDLSQGFAYLVCYCNATVAPVASAYCGRLAYALTDLKDEITNKERSAADSAKGGQAYDDEAISDVNYYDNKHDEDRTIICKTETQENGRSSSGEDAANTCPCEGEEEQQTENVSRETNDGEKAKGGLSGGNFYGRMEKQIERIFATHETEADLENALEDSRFVKISYGDGKYYVFGVLRVEGEVKYICYGVPSVNGVTPPPSLSGCSSYVKCRSGGYWMMYQDADTGVSVDVESC